MTPSKAMFPGSRTVQMRQIIYAVLIAALASASPVWAQPNPWAGSWRGTISTAQAQNPVVPLADTADVAATAAETPAAPVTENTGVTLTLAGEPGAYTGVVTGFAQGREIRLSNIETTDTELTLEGSADTDFGPLALSYSLTRDERTLSGAGRITLGDHGFDVTIELTRRRRAEVPQPQVEQRIGYFTGSWTFEYTGGEFPPLSIGTRSGTVTFTDIAHGPFVQGDVAGEVFGEPYSETWTIGFDAVAQSLVWHEALSTGQRLIALGNWTSPIGITFLTMPMEAEGRLFVLRRLMQVTSDTSFAVTDEFSVDGGPFQRLGNGAYVRQN